MKIEKICVKNGGYVHCRSGFYTVHDSLNYEKKFEFTVGVNKLIGEIDSHIWAVSYYLSMFKYRPKDFVLYKQLEVVVNDTTLPLNELLKYTCYMDKLYPLFSTKKSVRKLITQGIKKNKLNCTPEEIKDLFSLDDQRFERPVKYVGNERLLAMTAIGYVHGKQVFCFPWLSQARYNGFHGYMTESLKMLESLGKIAIVPVGE